MTLNALGPGETGRVAAVSGGGPLRQRLLDMGLTPGVSVRVVRRAPLGDPMEIELRGYVLSLRGDDARRITINAEANA